MQCQRSQGRATKEQGRDAETLQKCSNVTLRLIHINRTTRRNMKNNIFRWIFYLIAFALAALLAWLLPPAESVLICAGLFGLFQTPEQKANALVSGGTAAASGIFGLGQALLNQHFNVKNWERQNEYNLPVNQMARFRAAGLNPNLIYEKGDAGNASSIAPFQMKANPVQDALGMMSAVKSLQLQEAERRKLAAEATSTELDGVRKGIENGYADAYYKLRNDVMDARLRYTNGEISLQQYNKLVKSAQAAYLDESRENLKAARPGIEARSAMDVIDSKNYSGFASAMKFYVNPILGALNDASGVAGNIIKMLMHKGSAATSVELGKIFGDIYSY